MVWTIFSPSSSGMYTPDGEFPGFEEGLEAYYNTERRDAEISAMGLEDEFKELQSMGIGHTLMRSFAKRKFSRDLGPLKDVECPKIFRLDKTPKKLGNMFHGLFPVVTETLKNTIETLEPDVHQFWPMTIELPRNKTWPEQYYGMRIATFLDSFRPEQSDDGSFFRPEQSVGSPRRLTFGGPDAASARGLAFSKDAFAGKHIWCETNLDSPDHCISDALRAALAEKNLSVPNLWQAKEV